MTIGTRPLSMLAAGLAAFALAACQAPPTKEQTGMVIGGALGGALGSQVGSGEGRTAATIIGTLIGAAVGGSVGRSMDDTDRMKTAQALENVRTGVPATWVNPDTGNRYVVVPTRTFDSASGPCRDYTIDATVDGRADKIRGTACREADGRWRIIE